MPSSPPHIIFTILALFTTSCAITRGLPVVKVPPPPAACKKVTKQTVEKFPRGETTTAQLAEWLLREGYVRTKEQADAKICAAYALSVHKILSDKTKTGLR